MSSTGAQRLGQETDTVAAVKQTHEHDSKAGASNSNKSSNVQVMVTASQTPEIPNPKPTLPHCRHSDVIFSRLTLTSSNVSDNRLSSIFALPTTFATRKRVHQVAKPHSASVGICRLPSCMASSFSFSPQRAIFLQHMTHAAIIEYRRARVQEPAQIICSHSVSISSRNQCASGSDRRAEQD
ncbi:hypothetical protein QBC32DRAFT_373242 [Pseudoneurospora amorphoporcata]|uniref:Uncharacterized protein n=1 Tax=Pseudoneurospora amorphoporcata TaxID=241081 RepID=A0AAN6NN02_9PEZI|nr:hypothetical protein QBC32DRAFT_373242 [Pseudoneurospora amorphoporcata]